MNKPIRIMVDSIMLVVLIFTVATMQDMTLHTIFGVAFVVFMAIHVCQTFKWMVGVGKKFKILKPKIKRHFIVNITLITAWLICTITGLLAGIQTWAGIDALSFVREVHVITGVIALVLSVIHLIQHRQKIVTLLKKKKVPAKTEA